MISPSLVTNFRMGFTRFDQASTPKLQGFDLVKAGFSQTLASQIEPRARQLPTLAVAGYQSIGGTANNDEATNYFTASNDRESRAQTFNERMRDRGLNPRPFGESPRLDTVKATTMRAYASLRSGIDRVSGRGR